MTLELHAKARRGAKRFVSGYGFSHIEEEQSQWRL
jgi:hypothetical protein